MADTMAMVAVLLLTKIIFHNSEMQLIAVVCTDPFTQHMPSFQLEHGFPTPPCQP
jgi:hypothetical protein